MASPLRALDAEMTPGPWSVTLASDGAANGEVIAADVSFEIDIRSHRDGADAHGIVYLRNRMALYAELEEASAAVVASWDHDSTYEDWREVRRLRDVLSRLEAADAK